MQIKFNIVGSIFDSTVINNYYCYSLRVVQSLLRDPGRFGQSQHYHSWQQKRLQSSPLPIVIIEHPIHNFSVLVPPVPPQNIMSESASDAL